MPVLVMQIKAENEAAAKKRAQAPPQVAPQAGAQAKSSGKAPRVSSPTSLPV